MYQNPPRFPPVPTPHEMPRSPRRRLARLIPLLTLFALMFFGSTYVFSPEPTIEIQPGFAFAEVEGREVVLVPYERHGGRGMFQLLAQDVFQVRLAAADPATGEVLWDTQLSDQLIWEASVLAAGQRYAYLATDSGLVVAELADGSVVAEGDGVRGLGGTYVAARSAYAYDPESRRVLAMNATGDVLAIGLDQTVAARVDAPTATAWSVRLSTKPSTAVPSEVTAVEAVLNPGSGERITLRKLPFGIPGSELVRLPPNGWPMPVGGTAFHNGRFVVSGGTVAGAATGHVLVEHRRSLNDAGATLSVVSLDTGQVTSSLAIESQVGHAVTNSEGTTVAVAGQTLAVANGDGRIVRIDIGATDFFGSPR
ncbi:PA2928 family protein [Actinophytocola sp.]|uniref:PA2928 family protein n=1 Tax=Actinophytocola sp. TaxID=1872138 RepID=UPI002ED5E0DB